MRATDLSELSAFDAVARHKSFTRAAKEREVTASAISHAVSNLENRLGVRLLNRTTRKLISCLDEWCAPEDWLYLCYPSQKKHCRLVCAQWWKL